VRHPSDEELLRAHLSGVGDRAAGRARMHLDSGCRRCARRSEELAKILAVLSAPKMPEIPEHLLERARKWIEEHERLAARPRLGRAPRARLREKIEEFRATLVLDSASVPLLAGVRSAHPTGERQLLFESRAGQVHLRIEARDPASFSLRGQFLPAGEKMSLEGARALVERDPAETRAAGEGRTSSARVRRLSPAGEFEFRRVRGEEVRLAIEWRGGRLALGPFRLAGPS